MDLIRRYGRTYAHAGLPAGRDDVAALLTESGHPSRLAAALVRLSQTGNPSRGKTAQES